MVDVFHAIRLAFSEGGLRQSVEREKELLQLSALVGPDQMEWLESEIRDISKTTVVTESEVIGMIQTRLFAYDSLEENVGEVRRICVRMTQGFRNREE